MEGNDYKFSFDVNKIENLERKELEQICNTYKIKTDHVPTKDLIEKLKELYEFVNTTENDNEVEDISKVEEFHLQMTPISKQETEQTSFKIEFSPKIELKKETPKKETPKKEEQVKPKSSLDERIEEIKEKRKKFSSKIIETRSKQNITKQVEKTDKLSKKKK